MRIVELAQAPAALRAQALAANAAVAEMTSALDAAALEALLSAAAFAGAALDRDGRLAGFLIGFGPGAAYDSPNYRWFAAQFDRFAYVDRVVTRPAARGQGVARALYDAFAQAMPGQERLVCEVNLVPPNPGSDAFHAALGFAELGRGAPAPGKLVRYLGRPLAGPGGPGGH